MLEIINTLTNRNLKISYEKNVPVVNEIQLLGKVISKNQIKPNPERAICLMEKTKPKNVQELQCWLGISNQYRKFIENYAEVAKPFYDLTFQTIVVNETELLMGEKFF